MVERSSRSAFTAYGIALIVVFAIIGLLWMQKKPDQPVPQPEPVTETQPPPQQEPAPPPVQGGTTGDVPSLDPLPPVQRANPYGPLGPFGPGGPGGPAGPAGPAGPSGVTPPE